MPNTVKRIVHQIREATAELKLDKYLNQNVSPQKFTGMDDFGKARSKFKSMAYDDLDASEEQESELKSELSKKNKLQRRQTVAGMSPLKSFSHHESARGKQIFDKRAEFLDSVENAVN